MACQSGPPWSPLYIQLDLPGFAVPVPGVEIRMLLNLLVCSEIQNARVSVFDPPLQSIGIRDLPDEIVQSELTSLYSEPFHRSKRFR